MWLTRSIGYFDYITNYGLSLIDFIKITSSILPNILILVIPICSSIATIIYYTRISQNNELVILRNSGLNKRKLIISPFISGLIVCMFSYFIMFSLIPKANLAFEQAVNLLKRNFVNIILNSRDFRSFDNFKIYSSSRDDNKIKTLVISINDEKNGNKLIYSETCEVIDDSFLKLYNGNVYLLNKNNNYNTRTKTLFFEEYTINLEDFFSIKKIDKNTNDISFLTVKNLIKLENKNFKIISEILYRFINPLLSLVLSLLSAIIVLNVSFSKYEKNIFSVLIFIIDLLIFAAFTYSYNLAQNKILGLYIMVLSIILPIFYIIAEVIKDDRKNFAN